MTLSVRDGRLDVVVVAGPRVEVWPSPGVRAISTICAGLGLEVGVFGGENAWAQGVLPLPGAGGLVLIEDVQSRVHRIQARAVVRLAPANLMPDPFPGWHSQGLIPLPTAERLRRESHVTWSPCTVILGTGNRALRFGSSLLESGVPEVFCVESHTAWGAKRIAAWEVERRRFEMLGGKIIEATPVSLVRKNVVIWELRVRDAQGIRVVECTRVVAAGPFGDSPGVREYPPGSALFELEQTAAAARAEDVEGWALEEERGRWLAARIAKALVPELGARREEVDQLYKRARARLKRYFRHREEPFTPSYQGKWIAAPDARAMRASRTMPQGEQRKRPVAALECFEEIPCNVCQKACPESAIEIGRIPRAKDSLLTEDRCTGCGLCVAACPSSAVLMIHEPADQPTARLTLPWRGARPWKAGETAQVVNRRGEPLGTARVRELPGVPEGFAPGVQLVDIEVPAHLAGEARALRRLRSTSVETEDTWLASTENPGWGAGRVEISLDGGKRLVRDQLNTAVALFELGRGRAEDALVCTDGSCGLCQLTLDGVKKLACQTQVRRGMVLKVGPGEQDDRNLLCPCLGITAAEVVERVQQGKLRSPEAVLSMTHVGEGKCHGQLCMSSFRRILEAQGLEASQWIDWRFPWSDWTPGQS